jgi:hypothetical protein
VPPATIDSFSDPACLTSGAANVPTVAVLAYVVTPAGLPTLRIYGTTGSKVLRSMTDTESVPAGKSFMIFKSPLSAPFAQIVYNHDVRWNWFYNTTGAPQPNVPIGTTSHRIFVTWGTPFVDVGEQGIPTGTTVTARRVDFCTQTADMKMTLGDIGNAIGPATVPYRLFGSNSIWGPTPIATAWMILDGTKADCGSLSTLMKCALDMLGATGSQVQYVYACHTNWDALAAGTVGQNEIDGTRILEMYFGSAQHSGGRGGNNYEGCCQFQSKWWKGGISNNPDYMWENDAESVLRWETRPNTTTGTVQSHQCYKDDPENTQVGYPLGHSPGGYSPRHGGH